MLELKTLNPISLQDAISSIVNNLTQEETQYIEKEGAESLHFSAGMAIRNAWIHPKGATLTKHFLDNFGPLHADDMSGMILSGVTAAVRKVPFEPLKEAKRYRDYWDKQGINPVTGDQV